MSIRSRPGIEQLRHTMFPVKMGKKEITRVVVALSKREKDFNEFRDEVFSSEGLRKKVELTPSHDKNDLKKLIPDAEILVCFSLEKEALLAARKLKWIHCGSAGVDQVLFPEFTKSEVILTTSRGMHGEAISDHIMAMVLAFSKGLVQSWNCKQRREWCPVNVMRQRFEIKGKVMGIVGLGTIGKELARKAKVFRMKVVATKNRIRKGEKPKQIDMLLPKDRLDEILPLADVLVVSVPYTKETHHMIGRRELASMKPTAILINIARGGVVDEKALIDALSKKKIAGAGLDVFEAEPLNPKSKLWGLENVILTPHISGSRSDYFRKVGEIFRINLNRYLNHKPLLNLFDRRIGY
jgi:D-2-hydroxyacid dehydrogenase (NADP+)